MRRGARWLSRPFRTRIQKIENRLCGARAHGPLSPAKRTFENRILNFQNRTTAQRLKSRPKTTEHAVQILNRNSCKFFKLNIIIP